MTSAWVQVVLLLICVSEVPNKMTGTAKSSSHCIETQKQLFETWENKNKNKKQRPMKKKQSSTPPREEKEVI